MNIFAGLGRAAAAAILLVSRVPGAPAPAQADAGGVRLLFSGTNDVRDTWGLLHFAATPMQKIAECPSPGFLPAFCRPSTGGVWEVYGQGFTRGPEAREPFLESNVWTIVHAVTRDGITFENRETVFTGQPGAWSDHFGLAWNPDAKEFLAIKLLIDKGGFAYRAFFSPDGRTWTEHPGNPLFYEADSFGLFWSPVAHRFVLTCKSLQPHRKHIKDHGGTHPQNNDNDLRDRRVLVVRSSADGRTWEPSDSLVDVWNRNGNYQPVPAKYMSVPDDQDPPDMEFYRGIGFWHHDRAYMVVLNYAASRLAPGKHAPQLDTEWWTSRDGLAWSRPFRGINALGDTFPGVYCITANPVIAGGRMLFHFGGRVLGVGEDRIGCVASRANAEFSTVPFRMPAADLVLNAAVPSPERAFARQQAYVMAGVLDGNGAPVPGFEPEKCVVQKADAIDLPLRWEGRSARELAGRTIALRFFLRSASVHAVTSR